MCPSANGSARQKGRASEESVTGKVGRGTRQTRGKKITRKKTDSEKTGSEEI